MGRSDPGRVAPAGFLGTAAAIVLADQATKSLAVERLVPYHLNPVFGEWFRLTLLYNPGAAFGLHFGPWSRWIFMALTVVAVVTMWRFYRESATDARVRVWALCLVTGGALGNLFDRIQSERGVVDFLDVGVGAWRWPTFNIADIAVSTGAILLAIVLWREEEEERIAPTTDAPIGASGGAASSASDVGPTRA
ncbi:MAG: signal peptidase II [Gemmatimonadetes bacterium]|nr:signal peptidase II [Gemmatimonadota bacterium]